ncbi:MAG: hypothetical protein MJB57_02760 [Gemmatimonadetes bacterium]|nr:hypothetical protein [Gemmatimonadota bacterium]
MLEPFSVRSSRSRYVGLLACCIAVLTACEPDMPEFEGDFGFDFVYEPGESFAFDLPLKGSDTGAENVVTFPPVPPDEKDTFRRWGRAFRSEYVAVKMKSLGPDNRAKKLDGQVDVRPGPNEPWIEAVGEWQGVPVEVDNDFRVDLAPDRLRELNEVLFEDRGPISMRVIGLTDQGPVDMELEVIVYIRFTASADHEPERAELGASLWRGTFAAPHQ